jgi:hypothetical protein
MQLKLLLKNDETELKLNVTETKPYVTTERIDNGG